MPLYNQVQETHVGDSVAQAQHAGMSESTVASQDAKAITVLTAITSHDSVESAAIATAIAKLQAHALHLQDPKSH